MFVTMSGAYVGRETPGQGKEENMEKAESSAREKG